MMVATTPGMGASNERPRSAIRTATESPSRTARHLSCGTVLRLAIRGAYAEERVMRWQSLRKKKPIREAYADRWVRERCLT